MKKLMISILLASFAAPAMAASTYAKSQGGKESGQLFFGAGISQNDIPGSDEGTGYQFFGGYGFGRVARSVSLDLEVGYMNTGNMDYITRVGPYLFRADARAKGLWATMVGRLALNPQFDLIPRIGLDFGDDDGIMVGMGLGFNANRQTQLRLEFIERDTVSSLQFNFVYRP